MEDWKPNYGGKTQFKKKNRYSQTDGDVVFRILPNQRVKMRNAALTGASTIQFTLAIKTLPGKPALLKAVKLRKISKSLFKIRP